MKGHTLFARHLSRWSITIWIWPYRSPNGGTWRRVHLSTCAKIRSWSSFHEVSLFLFLSGIFRISVMSKEVIMSKRPMQSESTGKKSDALESFSQPVWISRWNRVNSAEKNRITEKTVSDDHLIQSPSLEQQKSHHCVREIGPMLIDNRCIAYRGGIQLPYLFPDIKNLFSTRGYYFGEGTSTRLELTTTHSSAKNAFFADAFIGSSRNAMPSLNIDSFRAKAAFFPLNSSGTVTQVLDGKMKGIAREESYETKGTSDSRSDDINSSKKVLQFPGVTFLPSQIRVSDVETTRICTTTVGSVEATPAGCHRFSRTTHGLFITRANADLSNEDAIFRTGPQFDANVSASNHVQGNRGLKLKQLSSCSNEEQSSRSNGENRKFQHKSSSEMEALDVGKSHSAIGANSATSFKDRNNASSSSSSESKAKSVSIPWRKKQGFAPFVDLNEDLPDDSHDSDPADRWVKRLKLSASPSVGSKLFENSPEPNRKTVHDCSSSSSSCSTSSMNNSRSATGSGNGKRPPPLSTKGDPDHVFSETWIKRLMRKREAGDSGSRDSGGGAVVMSGCKAPESQLLDRKPFPSIAAMALVGRAMNCVPSYEVRNEGSLTFWNA